MLAKEIYYDTIDITQNNYSFETTLKKLTNNLQSTQAKIFFSGVIYASSYFWGKNVRFSSSEKVLLEVMEMQDGIKYLTTKLDSMDVKFDSKLENIKDSVHNIDKRLTIIETRLNVATDWKTKFVWPMILAIVGGVVVIIGQFLLTT